MKRILHLLLLLIFLLLPALAHASLYGTGGTEAVVPGTGDVTHTFTNATASETFTLSQATTVRLLVVGGGGGGGSDCAGGGGGGGVIEVASVTLPADTYTVTVGAGGAGGRSSQNGGIGGATTITDSSGTILYKALGGGGGVGYKGSTYAERQRRSRVRKRHPRRGRVVRRGRRRRIVGRWQEVFVPGPARRGRRRSRRLWHSGTLQPDIP